MAIKSGERVTASDFLNLKNALLTLFSNRTISIEGRTLSNISNNPYKAVDSLDAIGSEIINDIQKNLIDNILIINDKPNILFQEKDNKILANSINEDLIGWINTYKSKTGDDVAHGCRGACLGICTGGCGNTNNSEAVGNPNPHDHQGSQDRINSGCGDQCEYGCKIECSGCSGGCSGCSASCGTSCNANCGRVCQAVCDGECYNTCAGGCINCQGQCSGVCSDACASGCTYKCSTSCYTGCFYACMDACTTYCGNNATGGCGIDCTGGCSGCGGFCQTTCIGTCAIDCMQGCYGLSTNGTYGGSLHNDFVYSYTGESILKGDLRTNWLLEFLTSGILTISSSIPQIDIHAVGGGGGGGNSIPSEDKWSYAAPGGGGGYINTKFGVSLTPGSYQITIGAGGSAGESGLATSLKDENENNIIEALGGSGASAWQAGNGGSGGGSSGIGGSGGENGANASATTGLGQKEYNPNNSFIKNTRDFQDPNLTLRAGGGGAGGNNGGAGGGGAGGNNGGSHYSGGTGNNGLNNYGGGAGGGGAGDGTGGTGGSGILIFRNHHITPIIYNYDGESILYQYGDNYELWLLSSGNLIISNISSPQVDIYAVGGGGGGGGGLYAHGGGGGYTATLKDYSINTAITYVCQIGAGGPPTPNNGTEAQQANSRGGSSYLELNDIKIINADGGFAARNGSGRSGGAGGSGGGGWGAKGGSNGGNGSGTGNNSYGGQGQGRTTRDFEDNDGILRAGGGGGQDANGGAGGGGNSSGGSGMVNYGGGGAGGINGGGAGGSGIIIIRNHRST